MPDHHGRPDASEYAPFYAGYVQRVPDGGVVELLRRQIADTSALLASIPEDAAHLAYAPGRWTVKDVVGHLTDTERVFAYRALRFARGDTAELPGFDQDLYVAAGAFGARSLAALIEEWQTVRRSTVLLFDGLPSEAWRNRGTAAGHPVSVRALAWIIAGHELHHRAVLVDRYLPALDG